MTIVDDGASPAVGRRRRSWTGDEKRRIVEERLAAGASIAEVARRHDLNANQLFAWRRHLGVQPIAPHELPPTLIRYNGETRDICFSLSKNMLLMKAS